MLLVVVADGQWESINGMDDMAGCVRRPVGGASSNVGYKIILSGSWLAIAIAVAVCVSYCIRFMVADGGFDGW